MSKEIAIRPCRFCGGQPVILIMRQVLEANLRIQCSECKETGTVFAFATRRAQRDLLPGLAEARRQAVEQWNDWGDGYAGAEREAAEA